MESILLISPVIPNSNGGGKEKRAHQWLTQLSQHYNVSLLVVSQNISITEVAPLPYHLNLLPLNYTRSEKLFQLIRFIFSLLFRPVKGAIVLNWFPLQEKQKLVLDNLYNHAEFHKIICFRLYLSEYAFYIQNTACTPTIELDLDDIESITWHKIATLLFDKHYFRKSFLFKLASLQFYFYENKLIKKFNLTYLCSIQDESLIQKRLGYYNTKVFPNRLYREPHLIGPSQNSYNLLFIGTLDYYPNEEAVTWLVKQVLPRLRNKNKLWTLTIAGSHASDKVKDLLSAQEGINYYGYLPSIEKAYVEGNIVLAPLHAGGGTKLKVLEAMWYGRPVIATPEAVYGLELTPMTHHLPAETAAEFVTMCEKIILDATLYNRLILNAAALIKEKYCYF